MEVRPALLVLIADCCWVERSNCDDLGAVGMMVVIVGGGCVEALTNIGDGIGGLAVTIGRKRNENNC